MTKIGLERYKNDTERTLFVQGGIVSFLSNFDKITPCKNHANFHFNALKGLLCCITVHHSKEHNSDYFHVYNNNQGV